MKENITTLVFFTVLSQAAAGTLIFRELVIIRGFEFTGQKFRVRSLIFIILLLFLSLLVAAFHLGNPIHAINALNNLGKSWLSREIFSLGLLEISLLSYLILVIREKSRNAQKILSAISMILGMSLIYSMINLYLIPSVASWNTPFTPVSFIITSVLCGIVLLSTLAGEHDERLNSIAALLTGIFILSAGICSLMYFNSYRIPGLQLLILRSAFLLISLLITIRVYSSSNSNKNLIWWVILSVTLIGSEVLNRYLFFLSFEKFGL